MLCLEELRSLCPPTLERRPHFQDGIPEEAFDLDCPNKELKLKILEEFLLLDQKYHTRLALLDHWHEPVLRFEALFTTGRKCNNVTVSLYSLLKN